MHGEIQIIVDHDERLASYILAETGADIYVSIKEPGRIRYVWIFRSRKEAKEMIETVSGLVNEYYT